MSTDPTFVPLTGGCKCAHVRFRMEVAPIVTHCCHCRSCQKVSGSAFGVNAMRSALNGAANAFSAGGYFTAAAFESGQSGGRGRARIHDPIR